ncbi:hypothetical protein GGI12_005405 [Dipsacomyces acuminosporus]|nr:hypothetical protein GGI12_005405 [Dipsacomyces acuminosporus]
MSAAAPQPLIEQATSRQDTVVVEYDFGRPIFISTKGLRTTNVRISMAQDRRWGDRVHVEASVSSMSTTLHSRLHVSSRVNDQGEYAFALEVDWSIWDLGLTNAEISIAMPIPKDTSDPSALHPGVRVDIPNGAIGATMLGSMRFAYLDLTTAHGPAHLSDIVADSVKLEAHHGNITVHDISTECSVEIEGEGAWMDIDDVFADSLSARSTDALISLKDVEAKIVTATTTRARIGLGNIKAGTVTATTTEGEVVSENVQACACEVRTTKGNIEGSWIPGRKLYLTTSDAKIATKVGFNEHNEQVEIVLNSKRGPINVDLPASFAGGFLLQTSGFYKTFIQTLPGVNKQPVLHTSKPDMKVGVVGDGAKRHTLRAITEDAPVTMTFGGV